MFFSLILYSPNGPTHKKMLKWCENLDITPLLIKAEGYKFVTILDPGLSIGEPPGSYPAFDAGQKDGVWIERPDGNPVTGKVWPVDPVYFVDFTKPVARDWWIDQIVK